MPTTDTNPRFTVIYPEFDVRGHASEHLRAWVEKQTLARDRYRVVVVLAPDSEEESAVRKQLGPEDKVVFQAADEDTVMWNAGAAVADTPWLVFTEGHCPAEPDCLEALDRWLSTAPDAKIGNFAIRHPDNYLMAMLSERWFGEQIEKWEAGWPRIHRAGYAIRRDVFEELGGYSKFGQFSPPLLSAKFHSAGYSMTTVPGASVTHVDDKDLFGHHFDTIDFVRGECAAREVEDPVFFEKYFGHSAASGNRLARSPDKVRDFVAAALRAIFKNPHCLASLGPATAKLLSKAIKESEFSIAMSEAITMLEEAILLQLPLPKEWRYKWFVRAHRRVVETEKLRHAIRRSQSSSPGLTLGSHAIEELGPSDLGGVYSLERIDGRHFRWSECFLTLRFSPDTAVESIRFDTGNLRPDKKFGVILAACGTLPLPAYCIKSQRNGNLVIQIPKGFPSSAKENGISLLIDPLRTAGQEPIEERQLGLPIFSIEIQ